MQNHTVTFLINMSVFSTSTSVILGLPLPLFHSLIESNHFFIGALIFLFCRSNHIKLLSLIFSFMGSYDTSLLEFRASGSALIQTKNKNIYTR